VVDVARAALLIVLPRIGRWTEASRNLAPAWAPARNADNILHSRALSKDDDESLKWHLPIQSLK